jgi:hypothetical protein
MRAHGLNLNMIQDFRNSTPELDSKLFLELSDEGEHHWREMILLTGDMTAE